MSEILIGSTSDPNEATVLPETAEEKAKQLPEPSGYRILCAIPDIENKFDSGLVKAEVTVHNEELLTTVLFVAKMGPDCYKDKERFPSGPWCKVGDFILVRPHAGSRLKIHGREFRIINDDSVEGVVEDPRGISRA
uniref:Co-chaperonin GroES n=1 Tax=uncultured virus TaxID=340016 RepID=A0A221S463_9VIRU|nr:co-chaperonin GroES [uncultured virus]